MLKDETGKASCLKNSYVIINLLQDSKGNMTACSDFFFFPPMVNNGNILELRPCEKTSLKKVKSRTFSGQTYSSNISKSLTSSCRQVLTVARTDNNALIFVSFNMYNRGYLL